MYTGKIIFSITTTKQPNNVDNKNYYNFILQLTNVELLLKNNLRQIGTVLEVSESQESIQLQFKPSGNSENRVWVLSHKDIKYIDLFLK